MLLDMRRVFWLLQRHLSFAGSVVWGFRMCNVVICWWPSGLSAVVFSRGVLSPMLENTSCCQELMCNGVICWWPSLATDSQCRKKPMIVCEGSKVRRLSSSFSFI